MSDVLEAIIAAKRDHVAACKARTPIGTLFSQAAAAEPPRGFRVRLQQSAAAGRYGLIAEIKKASPSRGLIRADFDPPALARAYAAGGAACLSVLTDGPYFQGEDVHLAAARAAAGLPVLRKDFTIDPYQVVEARALGADCILLIVAALDDAALRELAAAAAETGLDTLVEVHDAAELERALAIGPALLGINNRNLKTLQVDLATTERLVPHVPGGVTLVCESGIRTHADLARMAAIGVRCFLVGEHLMSQPDVEGATRRLLEGAPA